MAKFDYSEFFRNSLEMLCIASLDGYLIEINPRWTEVLGFSEEELKGKPFIEFVHPNDRAATMAEAQKLAMGTHQTIHFENRYITKQGHYKWLAWNSQKVGDNLYATARDITELKEEQRYFSEIQEAANIGYWRVDPETNTPIWSKKTYEIHGIPYGQEIDMGKALDFYPHQARELISNAVAKGINEGVPWDLEIPFITADNRNLWVRAIGRPVFENGELVDLYGVFQDVTNSKEMELRLKYLVENTGDGLWDWHIEDDYEYMSPRFWDILGYKPEEKKHHPSEWQSLIFEDDARKILKNFELHVATRGAHPFWQETRYRHKNGSTVWVVCQGKVIEWSDDGRPIRMVGSHTDVTQLKKVQAQLTETAKLASLGEMAGGIAHEINNPLAIISSACLLLRNFLASDMKNRDEKMESAVIKIEKTVERIADIISGMRHLLRDGAVEMYKPYEIKEIIEETLSMCRAKVKSQGIKLKIDMDDSLKIFCNPTQVSQVILNLLNNSIQAVQNQKGSKWIQLSVKGEENSLCLKVTDSGAGIDTKIQDRIFEPFFTSKAVGEGTGLGLSISREIARKHGGSLALDFQDKHTSFVLRLPLLEEAKKAS